MATQKPIERGDNRVDGRRAAPTIKAQLVNSEHTFAQVVTRQLPIRSSLVLAQIQNKTTKLAMRGTSKMLTKKKRLSEQPSDTDRSSSVNASKTRGDVKIEASISRSIDTTNTIANEHIVDTTPVATNVTPPTNNNTFDNQKRTESETGSKTPDLAGKFRTTKLDHSVRNDPSAHKAQANITNTAQAERLLDVDGTQPIESLQISNLGEVDVSVIQLIRHGNIYFDHHGSASTTDAKAHSMTIEIIWVNGATTHSRLTGSLGRIHNLTTNMVKVDSAAYQATKPARDATDGTAQSLPVLPSKKSLMDLPRELRNQIYEFALVEKDYVEINESSHSYPALLRVSKQVRDEAFSIYLKKNKFIGTLKDLRVEPTFNHWSRAYHPQIEIYWTWKGKPSWKNLLQWLKIWHRSIKCGVPVSVIPLKSRDSNVQYVKGWRDSDPECASIDKARDIVFKLTWDVDGWEPIKVVLESWKRQWESRGCFRFAE